MKHLRANLESSYSGSMELRYPGRGGVTQLLRNVEKLEMLRTYRQKP